MWVTRPERPKGVKDEGPLDGKNVLHLLIIAMLGFDWDGGSSVGMYPNFMDLFDISIVLYQKERFVNLHFFLDLI